MTGEPDPLFDPYIFRLARFAENEAAFERAWAHFRLDDMNGALSLLHNLDSPWFAASSRCRAAVTVWLWLMEP